ncbi:MAG TPA: hypothetical protein VIF60_19335 [Burkholderiaceae bacterium]|jgi:hypothetical protein
MKNIDELRALVEGVFNDENDYDEALEELNRQIAAQPFSADLLKLRIALQEAAYDRTAVWKDRKTLLSLQPDDLDLALDIAHSQYYWAQMFAEHECGAQLEATGAYRLDEADETEAEAIQSSPAFLAAQEFVAQKSDALQEQAVATYHALMRQHAHDVDSALKIFDYWDKTVFWQPWQSYLLLLTALQARPDAFAFRKREALYLASLARHEEEGLTKVPTGYFADQVLGNIHARTAYDALDAISAIAGHEQDLELLAARAELQQALGDYATAANNYRRIANLCEIELAKSDESEHASWNEKIADAIQSAANCDGGYKTIQEHHIASLGSAVNQFQARMDELEGKMRERFGESYSRGEKPNFDDAMGSLREWEGKLDQLVSMPTEEEKTTLREKAASVAARTVGLVRFTPVILNPMNRSDFTSDLPDWFEEIEAAAHTQNMEFTGWFQNLQSVEALKKEAPGQLWLSPERDFEFTAEAAGTTRLKRCITEFNDGSLMITADARGSGFYSSGPEVDSFNVFKSTPITEMLALHRARLAAKLARHPRLRVVPIDGLTRAQEVEGLMKRHANEFRIKFGITDAEARGMNVKHHAFFVAELKREVAERVASIVVPD